MKLTILCILICSLVFVSCDNNDWEKYLVNINVANEPIIDEWVPKAVTGYEKTNFEGQSTAFPVGNYGFFIMRDLLHKFAATPSTNVRSLNIPKGLAVNAVGSFKIDDFPTNKRKEIGSSMDGARIDYGNKFVDSVAYPWSYVPPWLKIKFNVSHTPYYKVATWIPQFITALIRAQTSRLAKVKVANQVNTCKNELNQAESTLSNLKTSITKLTHTKTELMNAIEVLKKKIVIYTKIISGQLKEEDWIASTQTNKAAITKLIASNSDIKKQIKILEEQLKKIISELEGLLRQKNNFNDVINTTKGEISKVGIELNTSIHKLTEFDASQSKLISQYNTINQEKLTEEKKKIALEGQLKEIQRLIAESTGKIERRNCDLVDLEKQIVKLVQSSNHQKKLINKIKEKKNNLVDKITKAEKDSAANDVKITETGKKRVEIETKISELKKQLSNNNAQIQILTASAQKSTKDFYQGEIVKFQTQISQLEKQLTQTGESINTTTTTISTTKITVTTKTECVSQNSHNVQKYTAEYTKLREEAYQKYYELKKITELNNSYLMLCLEGFSDGLTVEAYLQQAKRNLHTFASELTSDLIAKEKVQQEETNTFKERRRIRRMRRVRRMRRRLI